MVNLATPPFLHPEVIMLPEHASVENQQAEERPGVPGTPPPLSPPRNSTSHRKQSTGTKEEDAVESLMKLATPVKSPRSENATTTPGAGGRSIGNGSALSGAAYSSEMTPVSLFRKSRQPGEPGSQLQSPFQSPFQQSLSFSPSCLFSPPAAGGTLDIPTGDTPCPAGSSRDTLWPQVASTPDRAPREPRGRNDSTSITSGMGVGVGSDGVGRSGGHGGEGGHGDDDDVGGVVPGSCGKRKGKALFTDRRGPQDHSRLGQAWCLGTPGRASSRRDAASEVHHHLAVANDVPATPDRVPGADGASVLPPTPQLLPPTPPPRGTRDAVEEAAAAGGRDGAAGILMGLRSPESSSAFMGGSSNIAHSLFAGLDETYDARLQTNGDGIGHRRDEHNRGWSDDWTEKSPESGQGSGFGGGSGGSGSVGQAPHSAPLKRYRRWASPVSLRNSHCKGSFKIEGMTLIRTSSSSSVAGGGGSLSSGGGGGGSTTTSRKRGAVGADRASCRVRSRGQSIADEPLSPPPKPVLSPEAPALAMSRRSISMSPAEKQPAPRGRGGAASSGVPSSAPRPSRSHRAERSRNRVKAVAATDATAASSAAVTPSPVVTTSSARGTPSRSTPGRSPAPSRSHRNNSASAADSAASSAPTLGTASSKADSKLVESSSYHSPEPTLVRRGRAVVSASAGGTPSAVITATPGSGKPKAGDKKEKEGDGNGEEAGATTCNCKKSKCLKLYCECFQRRQYCTDCNCQECYNTPHTEAARQVAIQSTIERNPSAFVSKFEKRAGGKRAHNAGCNCKKSACLKKYCECFQAGVACGTNCKCSNCKNYEGAAGGRKRRAPDPEAAIAAQQAPRTPPRASTRGRGSGRGNTAKHNEEEVNAASAGPESPDSQHVQVGGDDDEDDEYDGGNSSENSIANSDIGIKVSLVAIKSPFVASKSSLVADAASRTGVINNNKVGQSSRKNLSHATGGSGGGDPSDTPPSAAVASASALHVVLRRDGSGRGHNTSATSPAAAAVADCAVSRSLLDMGGTPLQDKELREDRGFELSVVAGTSGGVSGVAPNGGGLDGEGNSSDDGAAGVEGSMGRGGGLGLVNTKGHKKGNGVGDQHELGMTALVSRARREREKNDKKSKGLESLLVMDVADDSKDGLEERAGDGNGGLVASGESKAGGQCLTPPTPAMMMANGGGAWKANRLPDFSVDADTATAGNVGAEADGTGGGSARRGTGRGIYGGVQNTASTASTFAVV